MGKISVVIITKNEEKNIRRCLKSIQWADEIVIVDSGSTDRTLDICQRYNCKIISTQWLGFGKTKQLAINSAKYDWVLSIDADEEISTELGNKIKEIFLREPTYNGYKVKRISYYLDKQIKHSGWGKEYKLRLFNRNYGNFNEKPVHETVILKGETGIIKEPILHYPYPTIKVHLEKMSLYAQIFAEEEFKKGKRSSIAIAVSRGVSKFIKMYLLQFGFLDGKMGFLLALNSAYGVYLKYIYLWKKSR
jgi:glycosyltransferase involved in cell wall biosynthesis